MAESITTKGNRFWDLLERFSGKGVAASIAAVLLMDYWYERGVEKIIAIHATETQPCQALYAEEIANLTSSFIWALAVMGSMWVLHKIAETWAERKYPGTPTP